MSLTVTENTDSTRSIRGSRSSLTLKESKSVQSCPITNSTVDTSASTHNAIKSIKESGKLGYNFFYDKIRNFRKKRENERLQKELYSKRLEFIYLLLQRLPFLYYRSREIENAEWIRIAYDLKVQDKLIPDIVRYQTGPTFFISFGSIATQIKREFFSAFLVNDKRPLTDYGGEEPVQLKLQQNESSSTLLEKDLSTRRKPIHDNFEYFSIEEMDKIIKEGDCSTANFYNKRMPCGEAQTDWFHRWGFVYETEPDCYRALEIELGNYNMELAVLESMLRMDIRSIKVPNTLDVGVQSVADLIRVKIKLIKEKYIPEAVEKRAIKAEQLSKCKVNSAKYHELMSY